MKDRPSDPPSQFLDALSTRGLLNHLPQGVFLVDRSQTIVYWNPAAAHITGFSAEEAVDIGLISRVVADEDVSSKAAEVAREFSDAHTLALSGTRKLLLSSYSNSPEAQMELESQMISHSADSAGGQEGITAFLQKRKPKFH